MLTIFTLPLQLANKMGCRSAPPPRSCELSTVLTNDRYRGYVRALWIAFVVIEQRISLGYDWLYFFPKHSAAMPSPRAAAKTR